VIKEEQLELGDIQGAIIPGFRKDHSAIIAVRIQDVASCKKWLAKRASEVARGDEVLAFNRLYKSIRKRRGSEALAPHALWMSMSFSFDGLKLLRGEEIAPDAFDPAFVRGMFQSNVGDASPSRWVIGGSTETVPHILIVVAADDSAQLAAEVKRLRATIVAANGVVILGQPQQGATLDGDLRGHEHFGFKDGISQPAVRGTASNDPKDVIDERRLSPTDELFDVFASPGRVLVWPGQFVIGYNRQDRLELTKPRPPATPKLSWLRNGSYLVYRRLRQKPHVFWRFCTDSAKRLSKKTSKDISAEHFATLLVGRWPSGAPLARAPEADNPAVATDDDANNDFLFSERTPLVKLADGKIAGGTLPVASADANGLVCPFPAHIRKTNPRDDPSDTSGPRDTKTRLMLRRGIPYGPTKAAPRSLEDDGADRGLLFMAYQASIENQFEFVTKTWVNQENAPHDSDPATGQDPIIGQSSSPRFIRCALVDEKIQLPAPWIVTTGGGYFFTPSISAISNKLSV